MSPIRQNPKLVYLLKSIWKGCRIQLEIKTRKMNAARVADSPRYFVWLLSRRELGATVVQTQTSSWKSMKIHGWEHRLEQYRWVRVHTVEDWLFGGFPRQNLQSMPPFGKTVTVLGENRMYGYHFPHDWIASAGIKFAAVLGAEKIGAQLLQLCSSSIEILAKCMHLLPKWLV